MLLLALLLLLLLLLPLLLCARLHDKSRPEPSRTPPCCSCCPCRCRCRCCGGRAWARSSSSGGAHKRHMGVCMECRERRHKQRWRLLGRGHCCRCGVGVVDGGRLHQPACPCL